MKLLIALRIYGSITFAAMKGNVPIAPLRYT